MTRTTTATLDPKAPRLKPLSAAQAMALPLCLALGLAAFGLLPMALAQPRLEGSILGAATVLALGAVLQHLRSQGRTFSLEVQPRPQHYLQACAQLTVLLYWGWYWRPVYEALPLLAAQLVFAYAFDMLLGWARRDTYTLGFAPFPVIFSINLFLWFKADWFYLQFLMIAVGFAAKELIRWNRDGRRVHIFNPSSFPLAVFSLVLILTNTTSLTWGPDIARTQFNPPHIYLLLFLVGLPGQYLFGVTSMTMSAVVTTYLFGVAYFAATGTYFFIDSYIPIAVFLGMHLLFTDPSTSPRTELGRIMFGIFYGLGNVVLYEALGRAGIPAFYDKLLPVPIMNLSVQLIDRVVRSSWIGRLDPARLGRALAPRRRNLAYIGVWTTIFVLLNTVNGVGDHHPGHYVPFWQRACLQNARNGCKNLAVILDAYCSDGSGWACNEVGALRWHGRVPNRDGEGLNDFARACTLGFSAGCQNRIELPVAGGSPHQAAPTLEDYPVVLRSGKGALPDKTPREFYARACDQGWLVGCESLAGEYLQAKAPERDPQRAAAALERACTGGLPRACSNLGYLHYSGDGVPANREKGIALLKRSCELGFANACTWVENVSKTQGAPPASPGNP